MNLDEADDETAVKPNQFEKEAFQYQPEVRWSDSAGAHCVALSERMLVGSASMSALVVADPSVSRLHAELDPRAGGVWVRDLGSRNGTSVEGITVLAARVPDRGRVRVGSTELVVDYGRTPTLVEIWPEPSFGGLIGRSVAARTLFSRLARVATTDSSVLIEGETGTGKELVARAIHDASRRAAQPFVVVDCASLPDALLESELFGHARGSFTGAVAARAGAIESADEGTVFLDEIGELPLSVQPKLLRVLESRMIRRVGESNYRAVNVRFLAATHRDLRTMVNSGAFREDLYFRLAVLPVAVPPLRERVDDLALLVAHFLPPGQGGLATPELLLELERRPWLGNVRELRNFVQRALALGEREALAMGRVSSHGESGEPRVTAATPRPAAATPASPAGGVNPELSFERPFKEVREAWQDDLEKRYFAFLLERHGRNVSAVAQAAGLNRTYVHKLIRKHDL